MSSVQRRGGRRETVIIELALRLVLLRFTTVLGLPPTVPNTAKAAMAYGLVSVWLVPTKVLPNFCHELLREETSENTGQIP